MKKRILCIIMTALLTASVSACSEPEDMSYPEDTTATEAESASETETTEEKTTEEETTEEKTSEKKDGKGADFSEYITHEAVKPALWKATDTKTGNELYLMGTIHIMCDDTLPLPDYVMDVYENCDGVAVEYNVNELQNDMDQIMDYYSKMVYQDGSDIKDHISKESYEAAKKYLEEKNSYMSMMDYYCPGFWISNIQSMAFAEIENLSLSGIDSYFITKADKDGKEVVNIETLDIQASVSLGYSDKLAEFMLKDTLEACKETELVAESVAELYNLWAKGDVDGMLKLEEEDEIPDELKKDYADYENISIYERNKGMAEKASEYIKDGKNYFFMVGALHFSGDKGVDDLLEDMGYKVERVK